MMRVWCAQFTETRVLGEGTDIQTTRLEHTRTAPTDKQPHLQSANTSTETGGGGEFADNKQTEKVATEKTTTQ